MTETKIRNDQSADARRLRMGFVKAYHAPPIFGVAHAVYTKGL